MKTNYYHKLLSVVFFAFLFLTAHAHDNPPLNQPSGTFSVEGANYIDNMTEVWYINAGVNKPILFNFNLDVESDCDGIDIYSIDTNGNISVDPIASYTGYLDAGQLSTGVSSGRAMVVFHSDVSNSNDCDFNGFDMSFSVDNNFYVNDNMVINGSLGIGSISPKEKLDINGSVRGNLPGGALRVQTDYGSLDIGAQNGAFAHIYTDLSRVIFNKPVFSITGNFNSYGQANLTLNTHETARMTILNETGNVGIGTLTPQSRLDVTGEISLTGRIGKSLNIPSQCFTYDTDKTMGHYSIGWFNDSKTNASGPALWMSGYGGIKLFTTGIQRLAINYQGKVGIGLTKPDEFMSTTPADEMLTVNGTIHAKEVKVDLTTDLADYVFKPTYRLMPLYQVEEYVKINYHLPNIPSATEVSKNGMNMGEMQNKLLQKVEELTLYVIEQQKKIEELEKKLK